MHLIVVGSGIVLLLLTFRGPDEALEALEEAVGKFLRLKEAIAISQQVALLAVEEGSMVEGFLF